MAHRSVMSHDFLGVRRYAAIFMAAWTLVAGAELAWQFSQDGAKTLEIALIQARDSFNKDLVYRRWAAGHGGVYVPVTEEMLPNPYLEHLENRDVTTTSGLELTLVNPAYMTRQVHELGRSQYGYLGHITSLKPIRPENAPDEWEAEALQVFEAGVLEVSSIEMLDGEEYLRLMRPLLTEERCLKCHASQGYEVGDVRGGISVSVPMAPLWAAGRTHFAAEVLGHCGVWLLGLVGIGLGARHILGRIRERERAEEGVREQTRLNRALLDSMPCVALLVRPHTHEIVASNKPAAEMNAMPGEKCYRTFGKRDAPCPWCLAPEVWGTHEDQAVEMESDGRVWDKHWMHVSDDLFLYYAFDVTEQKRAAEEEELRQEQLIQADKMISLGILVSGVAHEINNPNHFIMSHVTPLKEVWEDSRPILDRYYEDNGDFNVAGGKYSQMREHVPQMLSYVQEGSERIRDIVNELRDYARGGPPELADQVQVNDVVKSAVTLLSNLLKKHTTRFSVAYGEDVPAVRANYRRLQQVVINLIQNACEALPNPEAGIRVATRLDPGTGAVLIEVEDQGEGIESDVLEHVTDPFFTTKRSSGGTGLGLSISSRIVTEHGGTLRFSSKPGEGTRVTVSLSVEEVAVVDGGGA